VRIRDIHTACRVVGQGPVKVLLLHALTGGPDAADCEGVKGWWAPVFQEGAPFSPAAATVWTPNLAGSCYGSTGPDTVPDFPTLSTRDQAQILADWIRAEDLRFDLLVGGSLGGMVALELALLAPECFRALGIIGCGAKADAWLWGTNEVQRAILQCPNLNDIEAIALARRAGMLTFRTPESLNARFHEAPEVRNWLAHHGEALAARFTRKSYLALLDAMDGHDLGRGRGGIQAALSGLRVPLFILGMSPDYLFPRSVVEELAEAAERAGVRCTLDWIDSPHGHDAFLIEWPQVEGWLGRLLREVAPCES
jgi:homoserine O-acetyltransferase